MYPHRNVKIRFYKNFMIFLTNSKRKTAIHAKGSVIRVTVLTKFYPLSLCLDKRNLFLKN